MTFGSTRVVAEPERRWTREGELTIRGVTRLVPLAVTETGMVLDPWGKIRAGVHAGAMINRRDFGLETDLDREAGGHPVGHDVLISVDSEILLQK